MRIGFGEDAHRLESRAGGALFIGGVAVPAEKVAVAHSDGDVLLHALADALLSGAGVPADIGTLFPDNDPAHRGMSSAPIVLAALERVEAAGLRVGNVSAVVTLDRPKLGAHRADIRNNVAALLKVPAEMVGIGFKTSEGLAQQHAQARVTVLLHAR